MLLFSPITMSDASHDRSKTKRSDSLNKRIWSYPVHRTMDVRSDVRRPIGSDVRRPIGSDDASDFDMHQNRM